MFSMDYRHINALNSYCDFLPSVGITVDHIVVDVVGDAVTYDWTFWLDFPLYTHFVLLNIKKYALIFSGQHLILWQIK